MNIEKAIAVAMAQRGMKIKDLAAAMGVAYPTARAYTKAKAVNTDTFDKIAAAFGLKFSELAALGE